nr:SDR family NAD(P)-dependent oxidoreductase [Roseovarius amoyensis]
MSRALQESTALIRGGTSGVGLVSALMLSDAGYDRIAVTGRNLDRGKRAVEQLNDEGAAGGAIHLSVDVTRETDVAGVVERFGSVDPLLNCAGGDFLPRIFHEIEPAEIPDMYCCVLCPSIFCCRHVIPHMYAVEEGSIINVSSDAARVLTPENRHSGQGWRGL